MYAKGLAGGHGRIMAAPERKEVDAEKGKWIEARGSGVVLGWAGCVGSTWRRSRLQQCPTSLLPVYGKMNASTSPQTDARGIECQIMSGQRGSDVCGQFGVRFGDPLCHYFPYTT